MNMIEIFAHKIVLCSILPTGKYINHRMTLPINEESMPQFMRNS